MMRTLVFATTALWIAGSATAQSVTVFTNGAILSIDEEFSVAEAMAIQGERILAIGDEAGVIDQAGADHNTVDLGGKTVLPGFIDPHFHLISSSATPVFDNVGLDRFEAVEDLLGYMKAVSQENRDKDWLLFNNMDLATQSFAEPKLTRSHLDKVSDTKPVVVWHAGGHKMTVNSVMLSLMSVTAETPNPSGAEYGRDDNGSPDGNISGSSALFAALGVVEPFMSFDKYQGTIRLAQEWATKGLTTVGLPGVQSPDDFETLQKLNASGSLHLRTRGYLLWGALPLWDQANIEIGQGDEKSRVIGWKISADGSNQAFTGLQREPYLDRDDTGLAYMTKKDILNAVVQGSKRGGQMAMHGNGDAGIDSIIEAVDEARSLGVDVVRPRIEHCSIVQDDQLARLIENEISCSFLIAHVLYWGAAFRDTVFGPDKAAKLDRTGSFERAGIPFTLHTDYSVSALSPLEMVEVAVTRRLFAEPETVLAPDERSSLEAALRAITSTAAWQLLSENEIGSLEVGKLADFVVLSEDPRRVDPEQIGEIVVLETWVDGKRRFSATE